MTRKVAKKRAVRTSKRSEESYSFLLPAGIGGIVAWVFSGSLTLGIIVFAALIIGNWMGNQYRKRR